MKIMSTYSVKIKEYNHIFKDTIRLYRRAVDFYIDVILKEWDSFSLCPNQNKAVNLAESFCVTSKKRSVVKYDFGIDFYGFWWAHSENAHQKSRFAGPDFCKT